MILASYEILGTHFVNLEKVIKYKITGFDDRCMHEKDKLDTHN